MSETDDQEPSQRTLTIMESVKVLTEGFPECTGMFYDELSSMVLKREIKKSLSEWMIKKTRLLLEDYISYAKEPVSINNLSYAPNHGATLCGKSVTLNMGPMAADPNKYENSPIMLLPSLFRLYR